MAKVITQEAVDKAVAKAVAVETKRCMAAVKAVDIDTTDLKPAGAVKVVLKAALAAIKGAAE